MKYASLITMLSIFLFLQISCKTSKEKELKTKSKTLVSKCPEDGICTFEVLKNKSLEIKKDDIGALYPMVSEGKTNVLKFEYKRKELPNTQDSNYSELIYVEIPQKTEGLKFTDTDLNKAKVLFARLCFCRGQTGYYNVNKGQLDISKSKGEHYNLTLNFKIGEVPQVITLIEESFSL